MNQPPSDSGIRPDVTRLLARMKGGDEGAEEQLLPLVYGELRGLARAVFAGRTAGNTLQPTALVHEAWLKLDGHLGSVEDRRHFFLLAGRAMRQVLADHARARRSQKRGGGAARVTLDTDLNAAAEDRSVDLVDLDDSLRALAERNERHARVAELRLFSGLSIEETAAALDVSARSVDADWAMAKAWLRRELAPGG